MTRTVLAVLALVGMACPVADADGGSSRLDVDYRPPRLSVEASGLTLAEILSAIGAKVGFTVEDAGAPSGTVTVSIHGASVEDVLRQLLRGTNHSVLYLQEASPGSTPIDKVVLLGAPGERQQGTAGVAPAAGADPVNTGSLAQPRALDSGSPVAAAPFSPQWNPLLSWDPGLNGEVAGDPATASTSVGDLLRMHAQSATQIPPTPDSAQRSAAPVGNLDASLAETTLRAQQDLAALVKGLAAATKALQDSLVAPPK